MTVSEIRVLASGMGIKLSNQRKAGMIEELLRLREDKHE